MTKITVYFETTDDMKSAWKALSAVGGVKKMRHSLLVCGKCGHIIDQEYDGPGDVRCDACDNYVVTRPLDLDGTD